MNKKIIWVVIIIIIILGIWYLLNSNKATAPAPIENNTEEKPEAVEPAAAAVRKDLAEKLKVTEGSITIASVEAQTWTDSCFGLGGPTESCLLALTPGFRVELTTEGETYVYRTNQIGSQFRQETVAVAE